MKGIEKRVIILLMQMCLVSWASAAPDAPVAEWPVDGAIGIDLAPTLEASLFTHTNAAADHVASQWQVGDNDDFDPLIWDTGWTSAVSEIMVPIDVLDFESTYYWRVRYQDDEDTWSDWSDASMFTTLEDPDPDPDPEPDPGFPGQPVAVSPTNGAVNVVLRPILIASSYEHPEERDHISSEWQVDVLDTFDDPVWESGEVGASEQRLVPEGRLLYEISYYWRVRYQDSDENWSDWSEPARFTTEDEPEEVLVPETPILLEPADGATNVSLTPTLRASAFDHPEELAHVSSQWQVDVAEDFSDPVWDSGQVAASVQTIVPADRLAHEVTYHWRVRYRDAAGQWSPWSGAFSFTTETKGADDDDGEGGDRIFIERFTDDMAGWTSSGRLVLSHEPDQGQDGQGDGVLVGTLQQLSPPLPFLNGQFIAGTSASGGLFTGALSQYQNPQIRFDYRFQGTRPDWVILGIRSDSLVASLDLPLADVEEGVWTTFEVNLSLIESWYVESEEAFNSILSDVELIHIIVESRGASTHFLDNVELIANAELPLRPNVPFALQPVDGATNVVRTPVLRASPFSHPGDQAAHAASEWQVDVTEEFANPILSSISTDDLTEITVPEDALEYDRMYIWRVRYQDGDGRWSAWSAAFDFTTEPDPDGAGFDRPDTPMLVSPVDGAVNQSLTPLLRASAFSHADEQIVHASSQWQIAGDEAFSELVWDSGEDASAAIETAVPSGRLDHENTYYWRVRYQGSNEVWSEWSEVRSFTTVLEGEEPGDSNADWSPAGGEVLDTRRPTFMWAAISGAEWYQVQLDRRGVSYLQRWIFEDSEWQPSDDLDRGAYTWRVRGWSEAEGYTEWSEPRAFTVISDDQSEPVRLLGPFGDVESSDIVYRWEGNPQAHWYHLRIKWEDGAVWHNAWYTSPSPFDASGLVTEHPSGTFEWRVRSWTPDEISEWSETGIVHIP